MNEEKLKSDEYVELDFMRLIRAVCNKAWLVALVSAVSMIIVYLVTFFFVTPKYEASTMFYVNNSPIDFGNASISLSSSDITASKSLVDTYIVILDTWETQKDVIDYAGVDLTCESFQKMVTSESVNETEVFRVTITSEDPQEAEKLANAVAYILPKRINTLVEGTSAQLVSSARTPSKPSSPNYAINSLIGFLLGLILSVGVIALREWMDTTIRLDEDITQSCKHPILVSVPDMTAPGKGGSSYYGYGNSRTNKKKGKYATSKQPAKHAVMGPDISFAASEAYKMLRTKLQFSFADENDSHVIGLSSALSGEGKSLTAVNLAYTLSQLNMKVLLVDCDMRRPTLAEKLGIQKQPGLSSYLTRQCHLDALLQPCGMKENEYAFHVISAGQNPPNPIELLSSERMKKALTAMREAYDYVILDLPPVGEVSDAMAVAKETDGILLVVRQNFCDRVVLTDAVRQFEFINAKVLGVVFNCTNENSSNYGKGYYKHYYKPYYKHYGKSYAENDRSVSVPASDESAQ